MDPDSETKNHLYRYILKFTVLNVNNEKQVWLWWTQRVNNKFARRDAPNEETGVCLEALLNLKFAHEF